MKNSFKELIESIISYGDGRNYRVFFVFVLASTFFWFLIKFSKTYTVPRDFTVEYVSIPNNLAFGKIEKSKISIDVMTNGFQLLNYAIVDKDVEIDLSRIKKSNKSQYYIRPEEQISLIKQQFPSGVSIELIGPDTIYFDFSKKLEKRVVVKLNSKIELANSFKFRSPIKLSQDSITVSGPSSIVSDINFVETKLLEMKNVRESSLRTVRLKKFDDSRIKLSSKTLKVQVDVEKFTQNTISVPVVVENVPTGFLLKTFPDNVAITFNTGLSDFKSINKTSFEVIADYNHLKDGNTQTIPLKINVLSDKVDLIRVSPLDVEFLLRKIQ
ncbi:MAG: YbbR-like domain-containing protein [Flavobacteriales bacterium]|nr:YbbR-like domain-containing protein [Flavobacteriales bacterium]